MDCLLDLCLIVELMIRAGDLRLLAGKRPNLSKCRQEFTRGSAQETPSWLTTLPLTIAVPVAAPNDHVIAATSEGR